MSENISPLSLNGRRQLPPRMLLMSKTLEVVFGDKVRVSRLSTYQQTQRCIHQHKSVPRRLQLTTRSRRERFEPHARARRYGSRKKQAMQHMHASNACMRRYACESLHAHACRCSHRRSGASCLSMHAILVRAHARNATLTSDALSKHYI